MKRTIPEVLTLISGRALVSRLLPLVLLTMCATLVPARAQAQFGNFGNSSDTWKSVAIIGGSTAAGAIIGHKVAGRTGAYIGAGIGAAGGYAIDRRRRQNQYNNGYYGGNYYPDNGAYGNAPYYPNGGYYPSNGYPNGGYYPGPYGYASTNSYNGARR